MKKALLTTVWILLLGLTGCSMKRPALSPAQAPLSSQASQSSQAPLSAQAPAGAERLASAASHREPAPSPAADSPQYTAKELRRMRVRSAANYGASSSPANCFT